MLSAVNPNIYKSSYYNKNQNALINFKGSKISILTDEFKEFERVFVDTINASKAKEAPPAVLLGFNNNSLRDSLLKKLKICVDAEFHYTTENGDGFITELKKLLHNARERYWNTGKRIV